MPEFETDVLGAPYTVETIDLPDDDEGSVHATLVRRPAHTTTRKAVLHVHGFADYFFQTQYAEWWNERGYDFYAIDLRKYGRSIRDHQTPNFVSDIREYFPELDEAWARVVTRDEHDHIVLSAHSTGGLTLPLWANQRRHDVAGMVLNSPWFDMQGPLWMRTVGTQVVKRVGARQPRRIIPRYVSGYYTRSLHKDHEGEWEFNLAWKPVQSWPVYAGWLAAIRHAHAELHRGLDIDCPVLVLTSGATAYPSEMGDAVHAHDIVLEVRQIRRWAPSLGKHVTIASIPGARHDVTLSREPIRERVYDELGRFVTAYVDGA
jgi:alpha-beta hydrolase superfamily lysophospholipase